MQDKWEIKSPGGQLCLSAFRAMGVMKHNYSCLSSLAVGSPYFSWHMVDGLELVAECGYRGVCVWLARAFDGSTCCLNTDTQSVWWPFYLLLRCWVYCVYCFVNWANCTLAETLVSLAAQCNCSPQACPVITTCHIAKTVTGKSAAKVHLRNWCPWSVLLTQQTAVKCTVMCIFKWN